MGLLAPIQGKEQSTTTTTERKLIPALDIKALESVDSLTFSIILHDECLINNYDERGTK